jgi:hypothetical protein
MNKFGKYNPMPENEKELSLQFLMECFSLKKAREGFLVWKNRPADHFPAERSWKIVNSREAGKNAGTERKDKYLVVKINGRLYRNHRIIYMLTHKKEIFGEIDHRDGNSQNNHPSNLRDVSKSVNAKNKKMYKNNASRYPGVCRHSQQAAWRVQIINPITKKDQTKCFSDSKFGGSNNAFKAACNYAEFLYQSFGYSSRHGTTQK